ncbi:MAG TPA: hypothetical protein VIM82_03580 [Sulfurimonas sp.]
MNKLLKITEHPILSGIILLIIGGGISLTIFDTLWQYIKTSCYYLLNGLIFIITYEVAIWKLIIFFILIVGILFLYAKNQEKQEYNEMENLTELDREILKIFDNNRNFGRRLDILEIARLVNSNDMLRVEEAVLKLSHNLNLLQRYDNFYENTSFALNGKGRNYILENFR